ncbi:MAG TPA: single-stranded DNA-binding protein [Candidatus Saccharimonadales bacterium]|nr:single-stranded DNA-binding protein [Candidatus Saccharimonadales bacterium]
MFSLNRATILGNLTRDPELKQIGAGTSVCKFAVATNRRWKDKDGNTKEDTQYHEVVIWGKQGELASQFLSKGKKVYIEGRLQDNSWEGTDGVKRNRTEIIAENFIPLSPKEGGSGFDIAAAISGDDADEPKKENKKTEAKKDESPANEINLDDIPF